jgi:hypothetical protein
LRNRRISDLQVPRKLRRVRGVCGIEAHGKPQGGKGVSGGQLIGNSRAHAPRDACEQDNDQRNPDNKD